MKIVSLIALFFSSVSLSACNNTDYNNIELVNDTTYTYYDGARNKYVLHSDSVEFIPVKPVESSSGIYDGGNYKIQVIYATEREKLIFLFNKASKIIIAHTNKNIKPNSLIEINAGNIVTTFLLKATSPINIEIKLFLQQFIK